MVFEGDKPFGNVGSSAIDGRNAYVMRGPSNSGQVTIQSATFYGTLVVEGDGTASCNGSNRDLKLKNNGTMTTAQTNNTNGGVTVYGYPLTLLIYDPQLPEPTAADPYPPQNTCADMGSATAGDHGLVYSGGTCRVQPHQSWMGVSSRSRSRPKGGPVRATATTRRMARLRRPRASR